VCFQQIRQHRKKDDIVMGLLEFALIFSVVIALYNVQQMKLVLKDKGHVVDMFKGLLGDHKKFKELMHRESDEKRKLKYRQTLNGLYFSLVGVILFGIMVLRARL
jgi:hypothetical protein